MLQLCFRSSYLSRWSWWRKCHCLHQGMLERSFRCWFPEKHPWGDRWSYVSRPSICHYRKLWKCHHCLWWYRCVCSIYHFNRWIYRGLKEIWIVSGKSGSTTALPIHQLAEQLESNVADILPAIHVLTGLLLLLSKTRHLTRFSVAFWSYFYILKIDFNI